MYKGDMCNVVPGGKKPYHFKIRRIALRIYVVKKRQNENKEEKLFHTKR
jgi:hypothetical protein